jgi:hypothetical protein
MAEPRKFTYILWDGCGRILSVANDYSLCYLNRYKTDGEHWWN